MKLTELMKSLDIQNLPDIEIGKVTADSRKVEKGDVYVAIKGNVADGHDFIADALQKGAVAVVVDNDYQGAVPQNAVIIKTQNNRESLAKLAGLMWGDIPALKLAVTGTNGKSSVAGFVAQILELHQTPTLVLGTLGMFMNGQKIGDSLTTPDAINLQQTLEWAKKQGAKAVSLEASSHGLEQHRLDGIRFNVAGFTNLSRDHLDYHGTMEDYLKAKMRLFSHLLDYNGYGVVNADDAASAEILQILKQRSIPAITYGENAALSIKKVTPKPQGQKVIFDHMGEKHTVLLPLIGRFQVENAACAALMAMAAGIGTQAIDNLAKLTGVKGRMEYIGQSPKGGSIYVDYAHTPAGLETVLKHARPHALGGKLHVVFGAGGDRDKGKRPLMGKAAHDYADIAYITDDNPRTEDAAQIRTEVAQGAPGATNIGGRKQAIEAAIDALQSGDILIVAGKGHESGQTIGTTVHPFNDAEVINEILGK